MTEKEREEMRDYLRGYSDGINGREPESAGIDDLVIGAITFGLGISPRPSDAYLKGYEDGKRDRERMKK